jgi:MtN3 and saliva related transmembrane protein
MEQLINFIGSSAAILTTIAFIPQVITTIKTKNTRDISLTMYILFCTGVFLWLIYGIAIHAMPLIGANLITFILAIIILIYKIKYG